jgi:hypothetical protein
VSEMEPDVASADEAEIVAEVVAEDVVVASDVLDDDEVLLLEEVEVEAELVLPVWEPTGDPQVDAALDLLTTLDPDDVHQHAQVFDEIHQGLRGRLTDLDAS